MTNPIDQLVEMPEEQALEFFAHKEAFDAWEKETAGDEGWWKSDTGDTLFAAYMKLLSQGFSSDEAFALIENIVGAIKSEYGE